MLIVKKRLGGHLVTYILRSFRPGDFGWIIFRHGELYYQEFRYNHVFEALVAELSADFLRTHNPSCEMCWIAEKEGRRVGSIALVKESTDEAIIRLLLVEPSERGQGIGKALLDECIRFARLVGYNKVSLSTNSELTTARKLYQKAGFVMIKKRPNYREWGRDDLVEEIWELSVVKA